MTKRICRYSFSGGEFVSSVDILLFVFSFAAVKNSCDSEFLKSEHECYEPNKGRAECRCRDGYTLQSDGQSCAGETPLSMAHPALGF